MSDGYVLHTDPDWLDFHRANHEGQSIRFTRGPMGALKTLEQDGLLVFIERGVRPHAVGGIGTFGGNEQMTLDQAWQRYGPIVGVPNRAHYLEANRQLATNGANSPVTVLRVENFRGVQPAVLLSRLGVESKPNASRGWSLTPAESRAILAAL